MRQTAPDRLRGSRCLGPIDCRLVRLRPLLILLLAFSLISGSRSTLSPPRARASDVSAQTHGSSDGAATTDNCVVD